MAEMSNTVAVEEPARTTEVRPTEDAPTEDAPKTIDVEVDGKIVTVIQGTVPSGIFPFPSFLRRFVA